MPTLYGAMNASASGLDVQLTRIEVAVSNLANAESTRGPVSASSPPCWGL